jgi:hypothetical protein
MNRLERSRFWRAIGMVHDAVTGADGRYQIPNVRVDTVDLKLGVATLAEAITVTAETRAIDTSRAGTAANISRETIQAKVGQFTNKQGGFSVGGPIVMNKVFAFGNMDIGRQSTPSGFTLDGSGGGQQWDPAQAALAQQAVSYIKSTYGYDAGGFGQFSRPTNSDKVFVRTDFNLSPANQLRVRMNYVNGLTAVGTPTNTRFYLPSNFYQIQDKVCSTVGELTTKMGSAYNDFRVTYQRERNVRGNQWRVLPNFTLTYGARFEKPHFPDTPNPNPVAVTDFGKRTDIVPSPSMFSPRVGFNWLLSDDPTKRQQVRGGIGSFAGRTPYVWLSNQYGNTGVDFTQLTANFNANNAIPFVADPHAQPLSIAGGAAGRQTITCTTAFKVERPFRIGLYISGSYSYNVAKSINDGNSSVARSNWAGVPIGVDVNNPPLTTSQYQGGSRINLNAAVPIPLGKGIRSMASVYYNGQQGQPYVVLFSQDANGDGVTTNDILFAPSSADQINVVNGTFDQLMNFIDSDCSLSGFTGQIATRNTCTSPWFHEVDFRYAVTVPTGNKVRVELTMDIFNLLNLFNKDWGWVYDPSFNSPTLIGYSGLTNRKETFNLSTITSQTFQGTFTRDDLKSRWQMQWGLRVRF